MRFLTMLGHFAERKKNDAIDVHQPLHVEVLEPRMMLSTVEILAAGQEGGEWMQLQIDGVTAKNWVVSEGANTGDFQSYTYESDDTIIADQVRVRFTNDLWDPPNIDRNLRVDAIVIDGVRFETEDPSVFSNATWLPEDGVQPGFRESEYMHTNGYLQFAGGSNNNGSVINIRARGNEGVELFELQIDQAAVRTFATSTSFQTFEFNANQTVTADQVRIEFLNDAWDPANGIDNNLIVDYIEIDGVRFETDGPDVYSTGTWLASDGIQPGFRLSDTLHANGYFQYASAPIDGGILRLVSSVYSVSESGSSIDIEVIRENGSDGATSVEYDTLNSTAIAGQDYTSRSGTISWADGESGIQVISIPILDDDVIEGDEQFSITIDNVVGTGTLLAPRTATVTIDDNDSISATGNGLLGEYYDNIDFTNRFIARIDPILDFTWSVGAPATGMGVDTFSVRWTGQLEPLYSETYTFRTLTDDGVRLWIDDTLIIDEWSDTPATFYEGDITLEAGVLYDIKMEFYDNGVVARARLEWSSASQVREVIPQSQLYAAQDPGPTPGDNLTNQTIITGLSNPTSIDWSPDGTNMYIAQKDGIVRVVNNGVEQSAPFIDIRDIVNNVRDRGLLDLAVHPDFENNPYVYLLFTYDPPEVFNYSGLAGPDGRGNRAGRLIRVTADASNDYMTAVAGSSVVLLGTNSTWENFNGFANSTNDFDEPPAGIVDGVNIRDFIASDSESHTVGAIEFGIDGNLFVSIGDGTSYNAVDPRTVRVQDIDNLSGKILRIDPITGRGLSDNPFFNGDPDANRSKVYQYGLRNPFRISVDPVSGQLYVGDVGWTQWEEINAAGPGANFGWPYFEGGNGVSLRTNGYRDLPEAQAFYASGQSVTSAVYALNHSQSGINAIILGDFYRGTAYPSEYSGGLFFNDLGQGIVRHVSFDANGDVDTVQTFTTGSQIVVHMQEGPDGLLYYADLNGNIGRWIFL